MSKEDEKISIETMLGVGKKKKIAGREYLILPVNVKDMHYVIGGTDENSENLIILDKSKLDNGELSWQLFGLNITEESRRKTFLYILKKYVYYLVGDDKIPMTEKMLCEHNWSFKEIGEFLLTWCQVSD